MKLALMTLGCPKWDLDTVISRAAEYGFQGVDFRGIQDALDVTILPAFTTGVSETRRKLADAGLEASGISSSIHVCDPDARETNLEEAKRTIPVALALGAKHIRIFGGGQVEQLGRQKAVAIGRDCLLQILSLDGADQLRWGLETHDHWIKSQDYRLLLDAVSDTAFGALWDMGQTFRIGGEQPAETLAAIGPRIRYVQVKDAVCEPAVEGGQSGWRYVAPGTGELPLPESVGLLRKSGYDGWWVFEHEKRWIPALPEPEEIFPQFVRWMRSLEV